MRLPFLFQHCHLFRSDPARKLDGMSRFFAAERPTQVTRGTAGHALNRSGDRGRFRVENKRMDAIDTVRQSFIEPFRSGVMSQHHCASGQHFTTKPNMALCSVSGLGENGSDQSCPALVVVDNRHHPFLPTLDLDRHLPSNIHGYTAAISCTTDVRVSTLQT
jgi:hypothetical protein